MWRRAGGLAEQHDVRRLQVRGEARVGRGLDVDARGNPPRPAACHRPRSSRRRSAPARRCRRAISRNAPRWSHGAPLERHVAAGHACRDDERACLDAVGQHVVLGAAQPSLALDLDRVGRGPLDLGAHLLQQRDQVVDLGFPGGRPDDRVALGQGRGEHRVLGAHDGHLREGDLGAAQPARRCDEVVAVAVLDVRAQGAHRVDVEVDRPAADAVAARVADDHAAETRRAAGRAG